MRMKYPKSMKLWIDDLREPPPGWVWAKSSAEAAYKLGSEVGANGMRALSLEAISFDHDLGGEDTTLNTVSLLEDWEIWPDICYVHTSNPAGRRDLLTALNRNAPEWVQIIEVYIGPNGELPEM